MEKTLNESIIKIRVELQKSNLKKSGKNKYAGFEYFELSDFLPRLNELMLSEAVNDLFTIETDSNGEKVAELVLVKGDEKQSYKMPFTEYETPLNSKGIPSMQTIQYLGALNTYYKRYLYLNAFGITDGDVIEALDNNDVSVKTINYKQQLMDRLKELNYDVKEFAKEHKLNTNTTQEEARELLLSIGSNEGEE